MNIEEINNAFKAALNYCLEQKGYGAQSYIAKKANVNQQYVSSIAKGTRKGSEKTRRAIASACGYTYEEYLRKGQELLNAEAGIQYSSNSVKERPQEIPERLKGLIPKLDSLDDKGIELISELIDYLSKNK